MTWERKAGSSVLVAGTANGTGKERTFDPIFRCDLTKLFPDFNDLNEVQQMVVEYGVKQKLSDSCARSKEQKLSRSELTAQLKETWDMIVNGEWIKKVVPKTPLEKAIAEKESVQKQMESFLEEAEKVKVPKKQAEELAKNLFASALTKLNEKIKELEKAS